MRHLAILAVLMALIGAGCGDGSTSDTTALTTTTEATTGTATTVATLAGECSATGAPPLAEQPELPPEVASTRASIAAAAAACDIDGLAQLARRDPSFIFKVGAVGDPVGYWVQMEAAGETPMRHLLAIFNLPYGIFQVPDRDPSMYTWPAAAAYSTWSEVPIADQEAVLSVLGAEYGEQFQIDGFYTGPRIAMLESGIWTWYLTGSPG